MGYHRLRTQLRNNPLPQRSSKKPAGFEKAGTLISQSPPRFSGRAVTSLGRISLTPQSILYLRHTIGNRAVNRLVLARLKISQPGDQYEREADRVADHVLRSPEQDTISLERITDNRIQRVTTEQRDELQRQIRPEGQRRVTEEEEQIIHATEQPVRAPAASSALDSQIKVLPDRGK